MAFVLSPTINKAQNNLRKHGVSFERAVEAFFDPFLKMIDASRHDETRDAIVGRDDIGRLLFCCASVD